MFGTGAFAETTFAQAPYIIQALHTKKGQERLRDYYEALGRFVDMFARAETAVTLTLWHYAKTSPEIAKIIFAGARVETASTYIKQLALATSAPKELQDDLIDVLQQLNVIRGARNDILHYGADPESVASGRAIVSDALRAKGQPTSFPISPTLLDQMTSDAHKIISHLDHNHLGKPPRTILGDPRHYAWLYKHPVQPKKPPKKEQGQRA